MSSRKSRGRTRPRSGAAPSAPARHGEPAGPVSDDVAALLRAGLERSRPASRPASQPAAATGRPAVDPVAPAAPSAPSAAIDRVELSRWSCAAVDDVEPQGLSVTSWVDVPPTAAAEPLRVRFTGRGAGERAGTTFEKDVVVGPLPAGVGRVAVTGRVSGIPAGEYEVGAAVVGAGPAPRRRVVGKGATTFGPLARVLAPGARPYAWPGFVLLGTVLALGVQLPLSRSRGLPALTVLALTLLACVVGVVGAKVYYLLTHRGRSGGVLTSGMSIQGFVLACIGTLALASAAADVPVGAVLDVSAPALLAGMAVGRLGCFFGGCCAGRPTASRWGLWSSDRVLGVRRLPVQLMEGATAGALAVAAAVLAGTSTLTGGRVFVAGIAAYTLSRQLLFPLRDIPRTTRFGRPAMVVLTVALLVGAVVTA